MNRDRTIRKRTLAGGLILLALPLAAQQGAPRPPQVPRAPGQVWRSLTTGKEYRVRMGSQVLYAEWVNIPPQLAQRGAYIRTECRRVGAKWVGTSRSYLPCDTIEGKKRVTNWCHLLTKIEIDTVTDKRIAGRGEGLKRFDCQRCKILETVWKAFEWVPKR